VNSEMAAILVFAAIFATAFIAIDHRLNAPRDWQSLELIDFGAVKTRTLHGTPRRRIAFVLLFLVSILVMVALPLRGRFQWTPVAGMTAAWLCWESCSAMWSVDVRLSLRRLPTWIITSAVGFAAGAGLGPEGCVMVIALVCSAFLVVGAGNELLNRRRDPQTGYRFAGTLHPNQQAVNCAMLAFSCCWLGSTGGISVGLAIAGTIAGIAGLGLARSRAAFWAAQAAAITWLAITPPGLSRIWPFGLAVGILVTGLALNGVLIGAFSGGSRDRLASRLFLFGRNNYASTLNGRTQLWKQMVPDTARGWVLGCGFGAFWDVRRLESIRAKTGLAVWSCHSTPIEIFVRSGAIGATLFGATSLVAIAAALGLNGSGGAFFASILVFISLDGIVENFFAIPSFGSLFLFLLLGALAAA
jgi:exopolysaccharide production protein ExoQ